MDARGLGPFVTEETYRLPDGSTKVWTSRGHRKGRALAERPEDSRRRRWVSVTWAPERLTWWTGVLFMIGSFLFALGSFPPYWDAVSARTDAITYFVGSLFFTSAGYLQYLEAINTAPTLDREAGRPRFRFLAWAPGRLDWWATGVQSLGTLLFNVSTAAVLIDSLSATRQQELTWRPDMLGSICFMIASTIAWVEVCGGWWRLDVRNVSWWIVALNLLGSVAFQLSAIGAFLRPSTDQLVSEQLMNAGTFLGAVCFLVGAYLLLPESGGQGGVGGR